MHIVRNNWDKDILDVWCYFPLLLSLALGLPMGLLLAPPPDLSLVFPDIGWTSERSQKRKISHIKLAKSWFPSLTVFGCVRQGNVHHLGPLLLARAVLGVSRPALGPARTRCRARTVGTAAAVWVRRSGTVNAGNLQRTKYINPYKRNTILVLQPDVNNWHNRCALRYTT